MSEMTIIPDLYLEGNSKQWKNWQAKYLDIKTCQDCRKKHGKIYDFSAERYQPEHERCRCSVIPMRTKEICSQTSTVEFGMKPISILQMGIEIAKEFYTPTMA